MDDPTQTTMPGESDGKAGEKRGSPICEEIDRLMGVYPATERSMYALKATTATTIIVAAIIESAKMLGVERDQFKGFMLQVLHVLFHTVEICDDSDDLNKLFGGDATDEPSGSNGGN